MQLTTRGRYAVTAMLDLALHAGEGTMRLSDIAERQGLSLSYLEQLFARLRREGLVEIAAFDELFANPMHPYTQALLAAVPDPDLDRKLDFRALMEGKASDPTAWKLPFRLDGSHRVGMIDVGNQHFVRAHAYLSEY